VDLGKDSGIVQAVRYYWYGEQDDTLVTEDPTATGSIVAPVALDRIVRP
jgi:hypothetical protein